MKAWTCRLTLFCALKIHSTKIVEPSIADDYYNDGQDSTFTVGWLMCTSAVTMARAILNSEIADNKSSLTTLSKTMKMEVPIDYFPYLAAVSKDMHKRNTRLTRVPNACE